MDTNLNFKSENAISAHLLLVIFAMVANRIDEFKIRCKIYVQKSNNLQVCNLK